MVLVLPDDESSSRGASPVPYPSDYGSTKEPETIDLYESDIENDLQSVATVAEVQISKPSQEIQDTGVIHTDSTVEDQPTVIPLSSDFLNVLGDSKIKEIPSGPKIPEEVSKRWGRILLDGLNKDHKKELLATTLIPENFQLLKAPLLNQEISSVMTESSRNRDKRLERAQNHLGVGIAGLTNLMSSIMQGAEIEKLEMVKKLSEVGQILLDLHYENTLNRKMLITPTLDKKFLTMTSDVKRDSFLFGENLGDKIKATKAAERSGLQIRNPSNIGPQASGPKKYTNQGNWRGPPRQQGQRAVRQGGNKQRTFNQPPKRAAQAPPSDRYHGQPTTKPLYRPTRK